MRARTGWRSSICRQTQRQAFAAATKAAIAQLVAEQDQKGLKASQFFKALNEKITALQASRGKQP